MDSKQLLFCVTVLVLLVLEPALPQLISGGPGDSVPMFVVTGPKHARYDVPTTFSVSVSNMGPQAERIELLIRTGSALEAVLNRTVLTFNSNGVQTWSVVIDSGRMAEHQMVSFQLRASHRSIIKSLDISLTTSSGFLMIQTDKVIYTPRQTVMYRVIALDDDQRFAQWPVTVDIKNPDLIILERQHHSSVDAFMGRNFSLPRDATEGKWSITAYFAGSKVSTVRTLEFEVKEYVLPTYKVKVGADEKVIVLNSHWLKVNVTATYSYGQPVQGTAHLRLGVVGVTKVTLFNLTYTKQLTNGISRFVIPVSAMRNHSAWFPDGARLFLEANVTEAGTNEVAKAVAMDTFFANPFYRISFGSSKKYFKPGFPYNLAVDVAAANGDPPVEISVFARVEMISEDGTFLDGGFERTIPLDVKGHMSETFTVHPDATRIRVHIYTLDFRVVDWSQEEFQIVKFTSPSNTYLHLDMSDRVVVLSYTPPPAIDFGPPQPIAVLVLSKGRLVYSTTVPRESGGTTRLELPQEVLTAAAPAGRVVAYFHVDGVEPELVSDSLFIDIPDVCRQELSLSTIGHGMLMPKQQAELWVEGGGEMRVGLLAVDKAVYFLKDERSLTRDKMFGILQESDDGRSIGDGEDTDKIFEYSGLQYMKLSEAMNRPAIIASVERPDFDISRLNPYLSVRKGPATGLQFVDQSSREESIPIDQVRQYFPESWLFKEITLPDNGFSVETVHMPDSITTWAFTAVGVGREGGVCMSPPLEMTVFKPFFAQVRLPYKAVRLEEVRVEVGIYNHKDFDINVTVSVSGGVGVCFTEGEGGQQAFAYRATVRAKQTSSQSLRLIPLVAGGVELTVDVRSTSRLERDIVRKTLHVVAEGRRVQKAITFPLDPAGRYSSHQTAYRNGVQRTHTATVTNRIIGDSQKQLTQIDLYMPEEIIQGSERCQISACGDLMGDIITTAVMDGDSLFESAVVDAEEAIGNLAPPVYALIYLNSSENMPHEVEVRGRSHVTLGVSRLLSYRKQDGSFALSTKTQPATWLTALVLKTMCHAERVTFVDHDILINTGFHWLLNQIKADGTLEEKDRRLAQPSREYDWMLSAETLIALKECASLGPVLERQADQERLSDLLKASVEEIQSPLVLAKAAYALMLYAPGHSSTVAAIERLKSMKRITIQGLMYWAVTSEDQPAMRPFWYHSGTRASSIEATAYALLVFVKKAEEVAMAIRHSYGEYQPPPDSLVNTDAIAGWLIQKRNSRGAFIGALDTAAATQALSQYSLSKNEYREEVDLHCNVTTSPAVNYTHSFDFSPNDAIRPKTLPDVPVGRQLQVETHGTGLGQMQVRVEYNVPVDQNADCRYNVNITVRHVSYDSFGETDNPVCQRCNMGCNDGNSDTNPVSDGDTTRIETTRSRDPGSRRRTNTRRGRQRRQLLITASRASICIQVCLRSTTNAEEGRTILEIEMLSGFEPYQEDLQSLIDKRDTLSISGLVWVHERASVEIKFNQIPHNRDRCVSFRAREQYTVGRRNPAMVTVRAHEDQDVTCVKSYDPVEPELNLAVYCASNRSSNPGQCRCITGICSKCHSANDHVDLTYVNRLVCESSYVHQVRYESRNISNDWVDMHFDVLNTVKNDGGQVDARVHLVTPRTCPCPLGASFGQAPVYFFGKNVDIFVDRDNNQKKTYLLDDTTTFVSSSVNNIDQWIRYASNGQCLK